MPEHSQQATLRALGDDGVARARRALRRRLGAQRRRRRRRDARRGRDVRDAAAGELVRRRARGSRASWPAGRCRATWRWRAGPTRANGQPALGVLRLGRRRAGATCRSRSTCSSLARRPRSSDITAFVVRTTAVDEPADYERWADAWRSSPSARSPRSSASASPTRSSPPGPSRPPHRDDRGGGGRRLDLDGDEAPVAQERPADQVAVDGPARREVVLDEDPSGGQQRDGERERRRRASRRRRR